MGPEIDVVRGGSRRRGGLVCRIFPVATSVGALLGRESVRFVAGVRFPFVSGSVLVRLNADASAGGSNIVAERRIGKSFTLSIIRQSIHEPGNRIRARR